jgi:hypothetical protein
VRWGRLFWTVLAGVAVTLWVLGLMAASALANHASTGASGMGTPSWEYNVEPSGSNGNYGDCLTGYTQNFTPTDRMLGNVCMVLGQGLRWAEQRRYGQSATANTELQKLTAAMGHPQTPGGPLDGTALDALYEIRGASLTTEQLVGQVDGNTDGLEAGLSDLQDDLTADNAAILAELEGQTAKLEEIRQALSESGRPVTNADEDGDGEPDPLLVADQVAHETAEQSYSGLNGAVWWIGGLFCAAFLIYVLYRQVMPRA